MIASVNIEKFNISCSTRNFPIPSKGKYEIKLVSKVENFIKRMKWSALEFLSKLNSSTKETHGFK